MKTITLKRAISLLMVPLFLFATYFSLPASAAVTENNITVSLDNNDSHITSIALNENGTKYTLVDDQATIPISTDTSETYELQLYDSTGTLVTQYESLKIKVENGYITQISIGTLYTENPTDPTKSVQLTLVEKTTSATSSTITVNNLHEGDTVNLYKVFDINANGEYTINNTFGETLDPAFGPNENGVVTITDNKLTIEQYNAIRNNLPGTSIATATVRQDETSAALPLPEGSTEGFYVAFVESSKNIYNPIYFNIGASELANGVTKEVSAKGAQPTITKTAGRLENGAINTDHKSVSDGDTIRYQIIADMPPYQSNTGEGDKSNLQDAIANGAIYIEDIITDTNGTTLVDVSAVKVYVAKEGEEFSLVDENYCLVDYLEDDGIITIAPGYPDENPDDYWDDITQIKIEYDVLFDGSTTNTTGGSKEITSGEATLNYTDMPYSAGAEPRSVTTSSEGEAPSNTSTMYTYGVYLNASDGNPVSGAEFTINNANVNPAKIASATTAADSAVFIGNFGVDYDDTDEAVHSVLATQADGYVLDSNARSFTLTEVQVTDPTDPTGKTVLELAGSSGLEAGKEEGTKHILTYTLTKTLGFTATGGPGTIIFLTMGAVLVGCSALFFVISRKKERQQ